MPGLVDFRSRGLAAGAAIATLTISTLLTFSTGATFQMNSGIANAVLFLDGDKNASSSPNFIFDGTTPSTGAGSMAIGVGSATQSTAIVTIDGNNGTNIHGLLIDGMGAGTSGIRINRQGQGNLVFDNGAPGNSFRMIGTNMGLAFTANSNAYDLTNPAGITFQSIGVPERIALWLNGAVGQTADLVNIRTENSSSTPVFAIGSQGKTAIGVGASTSTSAQLSVAGITSSTQFSAGAGSVSSPAINFSGAGETNTGFFIDAGGRMAVAVDGVLEATWYSTHFEVNDDILPASSGALDLGSTVRYFRNGYFSESVSSTVVTTTEIWVGSSIRPHVNEGATLGVTGNRFGALYLDTRPAENAVNIITSSPYEIHFTGASGADVQSSASTLKIGVASTFATQLYSNGAESTPQLNLETNGDITARPGATTTVSMRLQSTSTNIYVSTTLPNVSAGSPASSLCINSSGTIIKRVGANCF